MTKPSGQKLQAVKAQLEQEITQLHEELHDYEHTAAVKETAGDLSPIDNHPADYASELYMQQLDYSLSQQKQARITQLKEAIEAIDNGTYGSCAYCGAPINKERLAARPESLYCKEHASYGEPSSVSLGEPASHANLDPSYLRDQRNATLTDQEDEWTLAGEMDERDSEEYVETMESFLATDITGRHVTMMRNDAFQNYMRSDEGDHTLEVYDEYQHKPV